MSEQKETTMTEVATTIAPEQSALPPASIKDSLMSFLPLVFIFLIFYFLIIRPQLRKQKEQDALIKSAKKGDKVIAAGGIVGKIVKEQDNGMITLEVAKDVHIEVMKASVVSIIDAKGKTEKATK